MHLFRRRKPALPAAPGLDRRRQGQSPRPAAPCHRPRRRDARDLPRSIRFWAVTVPHLTETYGPAPTALGSTVTLTYTIGTQMVYRLTEAGWSIDGRGIGAISWLSLVSTIDGLQRDESCFENVIVTPGDGPAYVEPTEPLDLPAIPEVATSWLAGAVDMLRALADDESQPDDVRHDAARLAVEVAQTTAIDVPEPTGEQLAVLTGADGDRLLLHHYEADGWCCVDLSGWSNQQPNGDLDWQQVLVFASHAGHRITVFAETAR